VVDHWRILWQRKGTAVLMAFLGALAGVLISLPQTPVYQARATIEIQDLNDDFLNMKQVNPVSDSGNMTASLDIQTQIKVLQSGTLAERVQNKLKVTKPTQVSVDTSRVSSWGRALNLPQPDVKDAHEQALAMAAKTLTVRTAAGTRIIEVSSDSTDPKMSADFVNTLTNEYIDQNMEARWKMTERTGAWLTRQIDDMRVKLERSEDALQRYAQDSGLMFTASDKNSVAEEKLLQLQASLSKAQADRVEKQSRYEMASKAAPETLPDVLNDPSLREYQAKLTDLQRQRAELITIYTPNHTKVKRVEAEIEAMEAALQREREAIVRRIHNDYDEALNREKLLAADYGAQTKLVTDQGERSIQYNILKREVDSNRQLYDAMLQKMKESSVAAALRASNVRVVDAAKAPRVPYKPNPKANAALGLVSGVLVGIVFIIIRQQANRALQEPGDASFYLNLPELGVIPSGTDERAKALGYWSRKTPPIAAAATPDGNGNGRLEMVTWQRKPSVMAESFRAILTSILFSGDKGGQQRLLLTSAGPQEGKTTVICNLSIALAELNKRVLIVDGDMRRPRLHDVFETPNDRGLSSLLQTKADVRAELKGLVFKTTIPDLFILPSGPPTSAAANLLHSRTLGIALEILDQEFDMILIDSPPVLQIPDARVIGRLVDGVILVVRAGHTTRDAALAARRRLEDDGTPLMGVIMNDWNPRTSPNGYYGYYNGYYNKSYQHYHGNGKAD
jgi:capsular exopolysaccharide synthesis family protein